MAEKLKPLHHLFYVSTTESRAYTLSTYKGSDRTLKKLNKMGGIKPKVCFRIDPTSLAQHLGSNVMFAFDRIVWNFPFAKTSSVRENQELLINFLSSASSYLATNGEVHVTLCNYQRSDWQLEGLLANTNLRVKEVKVFEDSTYPEFLRRKSTEDKEWEMYPGSAIQFVIVAHLNGTEQLSRKLFYLNWNQMRESLHRDCIPKIGTGSVSKRKSPEETNGTGTAFVPGGGGGGAGVKRAMFTSSVNPAVTIKVFVESSN